MILKQQLAISISFLCSFVVAQNIVTISGNNKEWSDQQIMLSAPCFIDSILVDQNGDFSKKITIPYNGAYLLNDNYIFLAKDKNLHIKASSEDFIFSGNLAAENTYWKEKELLFSQFLNDSVLFQQEEQTFFTEQKALFEKLELLKSNIQDSVFWKNEIENSVYEKKYQEFIYWFTDIKMSVTMMQFMLKVNDFDNDNIVNYQNSPAYRQWVRISFKMKDMKNSMKQRTNEEWIDELISKRNKLQNSLIKDDLGLIILAEIDNKNEEQINQSIYKKIIESTECNIVKNVISRDLESINRLKSGTLSVDFNFENYQGGKTKLSDLKGSLVYIDVWATWCKPCVEESPYFKKLEEKFKGKNIVFVSISVDDIKAHDKWRSFLDHKGASKYDLFADKSWKSEFIEFYNIKGIPRFILIGKNGEIISGDAPRPSNTEEIEQLFKKFIK